VLKPDLVVKIRERVLVIDVTVRHEDGSALEQARQCKLDKNTPVVEELKMRMGAVEGAVIPIVTGTRGAMPNKTVEALRQLNIINRKVLITISLIALSNSINIYNTFMDYDAGGGVDG
jgi:hypothetical protein